MRVVATLTTRNNYHKGLKDNLDSLTKQFDEVYLGLPYKNLKGEEYKDFSHPNVTIVRLEEDIGPASKLLGGLIKEKRDLNTLIVSVDDDYIYRDDLRQIFENKRLKDIENNRDRVMTFSGVYMKYWNFGTFGINGGWHDKNYFFDWNENKEITTIAGYCGCSYPANIFNDTQEYINFIKKYKNDKILFRNDDILISAYLSNLGIEKIRINAPNNSIGEYKKEENEERISPDKQEIYENIYKLQDYFIKNNPKKYTLVGLDIIILVSIIFLSILLYFLFKFKNV